MFKVLSTIFFITFFAIGCAPYPYIHNQKLMSASSKKHLLNYFKQANTPYPPKHLALLIFKQSRKLELYSKYLKKWHYIKSYKIAAASGHLGPKLHEGDRQVPEGIYHISGLNPFSHYTLSMKINYPNNFDKTIAKKNHRHNLGGDIFIHGKALSIGCIAIGDSNIEELFPLVALTGIHNTDVIIAPNDFRLKKLYYHKKHSKWINNLYHQINSTLKKFPLPKEYYIS